MAWIESHQALGHHPKTVKLADELGVNILTAVGLIHFLWWWALDYAPDGVIKSADQRAAAKACLWTKKPEVFWAGLLVAGFVEGSTENESDDLVLHDWFDYAGRLIQKRAANVERVRRARHANGTHNERVTNAYGTGLPTVPDQPYLTNQPDQPDQPNPPYPPFAPSEEGACCQFAELTKGERHAKSCPNAVPA
jgi:hypothetical protein